MTTSLDLEVELHSSNTGSLECEEAACFKKEQSGSEKNVKMKPQCEVTPSPLLDHVVQKLQDRARPNALENSSGASEPGSSIASAAEVLDVSKLDYTFFENKFSKVRLLGRGAFGAVWHCKSLEDGKHYAVKIVRYRSGVGAGFGIEKHVVREAQTLALMDHPNVLHFHHAWIETDAKGCVPADLAPSDASCSTRALSWPSTPATPFAPPPSPAQRLKMPTLSLSDPWPLTDLSKCTYDASSCGSGIVFFEWNGEEEEIEEMSRRVEVEGLKTRTGCRNTERPSATLQDPDLSSEYFATLYLQVELCKEETLQTWIAHRNARFGSCSNASVGQTWAKEGFRILLQCTLALSHLHSQSCVHRDVKPSNILFSVKDNNVRLGDFGLAKVLSGDADCTLCPGSPDTMRSSRKGSCGLGTPSYASPEQLSSRQLDTASDVFSLGLVLAEILCPVKTQMERASVLEGLRHKRQLPATAVAVFPVLAHLAMQMTQVDPRDRPTAAEILKVVRLVCHDLRQKRRRGQIEVAARGAATDSSSSRVCAAMHIGCKNAAPHSHRHHRSSGSRNFAGAGSFIWRRWLQHRQLGHKSFASKAARGKTVKSLAA